MTKESQKLTRRVLQPLFEVIRIVLVEVAEMRARTFLNTHTLIPT